jgi:hypothetical protein
MNPQFATKPGGLAPLLASDFLLSNIATKDGNRSLAQLLGDVKAYLAKEQASTAFEALVNDGYVTDRSGRVTLSKTGADQVKARFGHLQNGRAGKRRLERVVWPAIVLGLDAGSRGAARLGRGEHLRAAALIAIAGLPLNRESGSLNSAISALLVRLLSGATVFSHTSDALKTKARSFGDLSDIDALRRGLAMAGLALSNNAYQGLNKHGGDELSAFASRVQAITDSLSTPPFSRKVAISQVYDEYGKTHADAGRLESFKERLLEANLSGALNLYPLDEPEALEPATRARSLIDTNHGRYHFIARSSP